MVVTARARHRHAHEGQRRRRDDVVESVLFAFTAAILRTEAEKARSDHALIGHRNEFVAGDLLADESVYGLSLLNALTT